MSQFQNGNEDYDDQWLMAVNYKEESINASLTVNKHDVSFQLDSAAKTLIPFVRSMKGNTKCLQQQYV